MPLVYVGVVVRQPKNRRPVWWRRRAAVGRGYPIRRPEGCSAAEYVVGGVNAEATSNTARVCETPELPIIQTV